MEVSFQLKNSIQRPKSKIITTLRRIEEDNDNLFDLIRRKKIKLKESYNLSKDLKFHVSKPIIFDDYKTELKELMNGYKLESLKEKKDQMEKIRSLRLVTEESRIVKDYIKKYNNTNNCSFQSDVQIHVDNEDYTDPLESLHILENNRVIFDKINDRNTRRQSSLYKEYLETVANRPVVNMSKIKITNILPKDNIILLNNNKSDINNNISSITEKGSLEFYSYYLYPKSNLPESREQFSLCTYNNGSVLFGGISSRTFNDIWILDPVNVMWKKFVIDNSIVNPRYGHSAVIYQRKMILFGGKTKLNNYTYNGDVEVLNLGELFWETPLLSTKNYLKTRRNHIAELVNNQILIHGGLSEENTILNDFHLLNINPFKWFPLAISENSIAPSLFGHTSTLVFPSDIRNSPRLNVYKLPDDKLQRRYMNRIKEKGIYLFGGKSNDDVLSNEVYVIKLGRKPVEITKLALKGKPPSPRYFHTVNFFEEGNILIVYGGRNDMSEDYALGDMFILDLGKLEWMEAKLYTDHNKNILGRCGHSSLISNRKLIIFGGMNNNNYLGSTLFFIDIESSHGKKEEVMMKNRLAMINHDKKKIKDKKTKISLNVSLHLPPIK